MVLNRATERGTRGRRFNDGQWAVFDPPVRPVFPAVYSLHVTGCASVRHPGRGLYNRGTVKVCSSVPVILWMARLSRQEWLVIGISIILVVIAGLILAQTGVNEGVRRVDGLWVIEERLDREYHRYYPQAEKVTFVGNVGPYNISTERHMELRCSDLVTGFVINRTQRNIRNDAINHRFTMSVGYKTPIEVHPYNRKHVPLFREAAPDQVKCIIHFHHHRYSRVVNITVQYATITNQSTGSAISNGTPS